MTNRHHASAMQIGCLLLLLPTFLCHRLDRKKAAIQFDPPNTQRVAIVMDILAIEYNRTVIERYILRVTWVAGVALGVYIHSHMRLHNRRTWFGAYHVVAAVVCGITLALSTWTCAIIVTPQTPSMDGRVFVPALESTWLPSVLYVLLGILGSCLAHCVVASLAATVSRSITGTLTFGAAVA
jgi:hypothetical protein